MSLTNRTVILKEHVPSGQPVSPDVFQIQQSPVPTISEGEALLQPVAFSVDPIQRVLLSGARDNPMLPSYVPGRPMTGFAVARVVESRTPELTAGQLVEGSFEWADYVVSSASKDGPPSARPVSPQIGKPSHALSVYGITGLTAYFGMVEVSRVKEGEVVVVSSAAGSVGSIAGQIAKIHGARVIGLTSSEAKRDILTRELGFDVALDYRAGDFGERLRAAAPDGPDLYFDCVGGLLSQTVMMQMKRPARVVEAGQISTYADDSKAWTVDITPIHMNGLRFEGFQPMLFSELWPEAIRRMRGWVESGEIRPLETEMTGLESLPRALVALLEGRNTGKMVVTVE